MGHIPLLGNWVVSRMHSKPIGRLLASRGILLLLPQKRLYKVHPKITATTGELCLLSLEHG